MVKIRVLSKDDIEKLLVLSDVIEAVRMAYIQKASGGGSLWPVLYHDFAPKNADMDIKSGSLKKEGVFGFKHVSWFGENGKKGYPELSAAVMLFDLETGMPKALMNGGALTALRTGAAAAIGARYLARPDARKLLVAGTGELAPYVIASVLYLLPEMESVTVVNPHHPEKAELVCGKIQKSADSLLVKAGVSRRLEIVPEKVFPKAVEQSDVIITATSSYEPLIHKDWIKPGTHISCMGADLSGKQELDGRILSEARVIVDDTEQCCTIGECEIPIRQELFSREEILGEIGEVILGKKEGRCCKKDITIFDSTGIALQDLACAALALRLAEKENNGAEVDF